MERDEMAHCADQPAARSERRSAERESARIAFWCLATQELDLNAQLRAREHAQRAHELRELCEAAREGRSDGVDAPGHHDHLRLVIGCDGGRSCQATRQRLAAQRDRRSHLLAEQPIWPSVRVVRPVGADGILRGRKPDGTTGGAPLHVLGTSMLDAVRVDVLVGYLRTSACGLLAQPRGSGLQCAIDERSTVPWVGPWNVGICMGWVGRVP